MSRKPMAGAGQVLEAVPAVVPLVEASVAGLSLARPTSDGSWLIDGARSVVEGPETRPAGAVRLVGAGDVSWRDDALGHAANLLLFPGLLRRDFVGQHGAAVETIVCAPTLPLVVRQVDGGAEGASRIFTIEVLPDEAGIGASADQAIEPPLSGPDAAIERGPAGVAIHGRQTSIVIAISPPPHAIEVDDGSRTTSVRSPVVVDITTSGPSSLIIAWGTPTEVRTALKAAAHLKGHAVRAARGDGDTTTLQTGVSEIDEGWAWLVRRLAGHVRRSEGHVLATRLAAQSIGDRHDPQDLGPADGLTPGELALLAARQARVFGDVATAARIGTAWASDPGVPPDDDPLVSVAAKQLADALRYSATPEVIASLRSIGARSAQHREPPESASGPGRERALPMVGRSAASQPTTHPAAAWADLLAGEPTRGGGARHELSVDRGRRSSVGPERLGVTDPVHLSADFRVRPNEAWNTWRTLLAQGLAGGPQGAATWNPDTAASLLLAIMHGLLGIEFDAPVGRLRIAPCMPEHLTRFTVQGITLGDARLRLDYTRDAQTLRYLLTPEIAGTPPLVVLEPRVAGPVRRVQVDGAPADLEMRRQDGCTIVPVQLPLDGPRLLEVELG